MQQNSVRIRQNGVFVENFDAGIVEIFPIYALKTFNFEIFGCDESGPVEFGAFDVPSVASRVLKGIGEIRGVNHQLFRNASANDAGSAQPVFFSQGHFRAIRRGKPCSPYPSGSSADHKQVVVECHWLSAQPLARRSSQLRRAANDFKHMPANKISVKASSARLRPDRKIDCQRNDVATEFNRRF